MSMVFVMMVAGGLFGGALEAAAEQSDEPIPDAVTLDWVLREVPEAHETWEITEMQIRQSQARRREVLGLLLPQVNMSANATRRGGELDETEISGRALQPRYDWGVGATASVTVFDGPRYFDYWQADVMVDATEQSVTWQRRLLRLEAELAFFTLAAAQREVEIADAAIEWRQTYLEQAQALVDAGMAVAVDVSRARSQVLEAEQASLEAEAVRGNAADNLATLLGRAPDGSLQVDFDPASEGPEMREDAESITEERADFMSRRSMIVASEFAERGVWWGLLPRVDFSINSQYGAVTAFNADPFRWSMGLSATWNLYDGGARYARADAFQAQIIEQELELERDLREANVQMVQALRQWRSAGAAIIVAEEQVEVAEETFEMVSARFESGLATSLEVSDASQELLNAELRLNQVRLQARLAEVRFRYLEEME